MSNKYLLFSVLVAAALLLSGCDFFRSMVGYPTSADIEQMRGVIAEREAAAEQARQDSLAREAKAVADSLAREAALDSLMTMSAILRTRDKVSAILSPDSLKHYCAVLGSFKNPENAANFAAKITGTGHQAEILVFRNGLHSVAVCSSDSPAAFIDSLGVVRGEAFFPKDFWILINE